MSDPLDDYLAARKAIPMTREKAAVAKILKVCGGRSAWTSTFDGLMEINFPMRLVYANISTHSARLTVNDLMRRPTRAGVYNAYEDALEQFPDMAGMLGIVYRWRGSLMAFHDMDIGNLGPFGIYVRIEDKQFFLERLIDLAAKLGPASDWL